MENQNPSQQIDVLYILGVSRSGSTILGLVIGGHPEVQILGELKALAHMHKIVKKKNRHCSCGKALDQCEIWSGITPEAFPVIGRDISKWAKLKTGLRIILGMKPHEAHDHFPEYDLFERFSITFRDIGSPARYFLDTSKSIWRLEKLMQTPGLRVKVIHVKRGFKANIAGLLKAGYSLFKSIWVYNVQHFLIERFLASNKQLPCLQVSHEAFCEETEQVLQQIGYFLQVDFSTYKSDLKQKKYHLWAGNHGPITQFKSSDFEITLSHQWKTKLSKTQHRFLDFYEKTILRWLT